MDDIVITLLAGAFIGWAATLLMRRDGHQGLGINVVLGIGGAVVGNWLFGHVLHLGGAKTPGALHLVGLLWGVLGACLFIGLRKVSRARH